MVVPPQNTPRIPPSYKLTFSPRASSRKSRSEEHTSELQSRQYLVCRLLLEKKQKLAYHECINMADQHRQHHGRAHAVHHHACHHTTETADTRIDDAGAGGDQRALTGTNDVA